MAARGRRQSQSYGSNDDGDLENPHDLRELSDFEDLPDSSTHFNPASPSHFSTPSSHRLTRGNLAVIRQRPSSPPPSFSRNSSHPFPYPLSISRDPIFEHPEAPENYFAPSPSDNEANSHNPFRSILSQPASLASSPSISPSPSPPPSPMVHHSSFTSSEEDRLDGLDWHQIKHFSVEVQRGWHERRIDKRVQAYEAVGAQSIQTQEQNRHLSKAVRKKEAKEYKKKRNAAGMQVMRAKEAYSKFLTEHDGTQPQSPASHNVEPTPLFPSPNPPTLPNGRFFPLDRQLLLERSPSQSLRQPSGSSPSGLRPDEASTLSQVKTENNSDPSFRNPHSPRRPALSSRSQRASQGKGTATLFVALRSVLTLVSHGHSVTGSEDSKRRHEEIIREIDREMDKLKEDRKEELEKNQGERRKNRHNHSKDRSDPGTQRYKREWQKLYARKRRAEDHYEKDFPEDGKRRETPHSSERRYCGE